MPQSDYHYKKKMKDRNDYQAQFMLPADHWAKFKEVCEARNTTPSKELRDFINSQIGSFAIKE